MTPLSKMTKMMFHTLLLAGVSAMILSCNTTPKTGVTRMVAEKTSETKPAKPTSEKDSLLLVNAAEMDLLAIKLGALAQLNGNLEHVKAHGELMESAHRNYHETLKGLASKKSIILPAEITAAVQKEYDSLSVLKGSAFDRDYTSLMLDAHKHALVVFETTVTGIGDAEIKKWAENQILELKSHSDQALQIQHSVQ